MMQIIHIVLAVLAAFRLTELFLTDRITEPVRRHFPKSYLLSCPRCMSVWCAGLATGMFLLWPFLNWPFAFAFLYLWHMDFSYDRRVRREGRQFLVSMGSNGQGRIAKSELSPQELQAVFQTIFPPPKDKVNGRAHPEEGHDGLQRNGTVPEQG